MEREAIETRIEVGKDGAGERLDHYLPRALTVPEAGGGDEASTAANASPSRSAVQSWIREGRVTVNGRTVKPRQALAEGDLLAVSVPPPAPVRPEPEPLPLDILHEDEDIVVVHKPGGIVVHPGAGNERGTLVAALLHHCGGHLCELAGEDRPGVVHRLDKDTSGCLVAAKSERAYRSLVDQFSSRRTGKQYLAVVSGLPDPSAATLRTQIGRHPVHRQRMAVLEAPAGKEAVTDYRVLAADDGARWAALLCTIHTGRTHQIRVHLKECLRCPILGDPIYGDRRREAPTAERLLLHAWRLEIDHPDDGRRLHFEAAPPPEFLPYFEGRLD